MRAKETELELVGALRRALDSSEEQSSRVDALCLAIVAVLKAAGEAAEEWQPAEVHGRLVHTLSQALAGLQRDGVIQETKVHLDYVAPTDSGADQRVVVHQPVNEPEEGSGGSQVFEEDGEDVGKSPGGREETERAELEATDELDDEEETFRPPRDPSGRVQSDAHFAPTTSADRSGQRGEMSHESRSDDWVLPLPPHLQVIVDTAPETAAEVDVLFERVLTSTWDNAALRARARAVYYEDPAYIEPLSLGTPGAAHAGDFAAEMRVRRERYKP